MSDDIDYETREIIACLDARLDGPCDCLTKPEPKGKMRDCPTCMHFVRLSPEGITVNEFVARMDQVLQANKPEPDRVMGEDSELLQDGETWLWCLHCARFFQAKDVALPDVDLPYLDVTCPFGDCDGRGFDCDIFIWNSWADSLPHWPKSTSELSKGLVCSLYPKNEP